VDQLADQAEPIPAVVEEEVQAAQPESAEQVVLV
jgi:hypothetical protein